MRPVEMDVDTAELTVTGKDGSSRTWKWTGEVHAVEFAMEKTAGFPKVEMGDVHFMFSRWPAMSITKPPTKEV